MNFSSCGGRRLAHRLGPGWSVSRCACKGSGRTTSGHARRLAIEAPGGRFELHDRAWIQADEDAWHGHVAFALDVKDSQPVAQALQMLLSPACIYKVLCTSRPRLMG